ncbi:acetoin utilization protein AcuC [Sphaerisporangium melleum]|uniref:Acetoin utilization protein AcuC n=1 Tax=Sphaerisporangium melleum TaxID=321316 RepID=A0A917RCB1_9ACTN|nr:acetoin utilization protein AcuC [Sphaerisporangium melleum]GGK99210.1 acetoin utilization protein AcuC [Sphaerisporangium melleum]GII73569.1 acetoin utilization protein AcuC [Sphaerisporangium melleum]
MSRSVRVIWDERLTSYDFGPGHPMAPVRVELTMALARDLGVLAKVEPVDCSPATDDELALVHRRDYIEAVKRVSATGRPELSYGLGTVDNPAFAGVHEASALIAGASLAAARAVWTGQAEHAVNIAGGLHHAMPGSASGFCVYNDAAAGIAWMLEQGARRVAYVDVDVHHGDGVQAIFFDDPRVLTISLHESPRTLFPGTGFPSETGADGTAVNVALPAGCADAGWLRAFHAVVPPLLREFQPDVLVSQQGCDTHALDPLAHLMLSLDGQRQTYAALHALAHETAGGRWVATGGGGYELVQVVPRAWSHLLAEVAGEPVDPGTVTPQSWRELVTLRTGEVPPLHMTDGRRADYRDFSEGYDPADAVDRAIMATRKAVFPYHGLDPMP